jgi:uncharacterized protein involved in exopolysaccharide biosynthesis
MQEPNSKTTAPATERVVYLVEQSVLTASEPGASQNMQTAFWALYAARWKIICVTVLFTLAGLVYAVRASPWFESSVVMALSSKKTMGSFDQLGGIAAIAGLDMGTNESAEPIAILKSTELTRSFIEENNLVDTLLRDRWAPLSDFGADTDPSRKPDIRDAITYFQEKVRFVTEDKKTKLITLSIRWHDPLVAADWANQLVQRANDRVRQRAMSQSQKTVDYLSKELESAQQISLRQSISHTLESELSKLAMARATEEYAFKIIDHATPAKRRQWPKRSIIVLGSALGGFFVGSILAIAAANFRRTSAKLLE